MKEKSLQQHVGTKEKNSVKIPSPKQIHEAKMIIKGLHESLIAHGMEINSQLRDSNYK